MVARIKIKDALTANFFYNENKVKEGAAECLVAENFPADLEQLSERQRLHFLRKVAALNEDIRVNSVHISLNFDPSENHTPEHLKEIARDYMERIGFGSQPYLVYQHFDAGHPHIHILTTKVGLDGKGIDTHHIAVKKSEPARKEIEIKYNLVKAEDMSKKQFRLKSAYAQKVRYGKSESRRAIAGVLEVILNQYKYTSLPELNAVLGQYNVMADRCRETSRVYQNNGLLYRILDEQGQSVGVPIKASSFYNKPTLSFLEERFKANAPLKQPLKRRVKNAIDLYFLKQKQPSLEGLIKALENEGINTVSRKSDEGYLYGITYIDHKNKVVFNGSDLGKDYSAKRISERCAADTSAEKLKTIPTDRKEVSGEPIAGRPSLPEQATEPGLADILMRPEDVYEPLPYQFKKTRNKKKRKRPSTDR
jgi:hypothetical protein